MHKVHLKITKPRHTKLGDYRAPYNGKGHRITVNRNLNTYSFFITLLHEFAHLDTWEKHKGKVAPHGKEWKNNFSAILRPFVMANIFPSDVKKALENYLLNPAASSCTDAHLLKVLDNYNKKTNAGVFLDSLPQGVVFKMPNGMVFKKGEKLRKFYKCVNMDNNKEYRVSGLAKVLELTN